MKMFSECSGECCVCSNGGFCLAGHGDDDFSPASKEKIIENLDEGKYSNYTEYMIKYLASEYRYVYNVKNVGRKKKEKQLTNEQPIEESFGGYTFKVVVAGNCVSCGKHIDDDNIFLCKDCQSKQNAEMLSHRRRGSMTKEQIVNLAVENNLVTEVYDILHFIVMAELGSLQDKSDKLNTELRLVKKFADVNKLDAIKNILAESEVEE